MATISELKKQAQQERRARLRVEFEQFQVDTFGRLLQVGDVVLMRARDVINHSILNKDDNPVQMVVAAVGLSCGNKVPAIGLIYESNNHVEANPHNNYCLAYTKTSLKHAQLVGTQQLIAQFGLKHQIGYNEILAYNS